MRILMIAPQPFFESRGAPFCVYQHVKALLTLGYQVDLITYPFGKTVEHPGLKIYRVPALPFIRAVKPGASFAKIPLDFLIFFAALWRLSTRRYSAIHTHEEAAFLGVILAALFGRKHLYYMHCDLSEIVPQFPPFIRLMKSVQTFMVRNADAVIAFYPQIEITAKQMDPAKVVYTILPSAVDEALPPPDEGDVAILRQKLQLDGKRVLLYTGTLEDYQGIDLLIESAARVRAIFPDVRYLIVGGKPEQVQKFRQLAQKLDVADVVNLLGQRPLEEMPSYMALSDVLLSPRSKGTHTPLKLYTYLRSGRPMLATDILSHTQILTSEMALLVSPTAEGLVNGIIELLSDPVKARMLSEYGKQFVEEHCSWSVFLEKNRQAYDEFALSLN